jgi:hypothetical protein
MRYLLSCCALAIPFALIACSPTFNWREVRVNDSELLGMLPCKPDTGARVVPLGGKEVELRMTGCDAGGATYAIASADVKESAAVPAVLNQWRTATLGNMAATRVSESPMVVPATARLPALTMVEAVGKKRDGSAVTLQGIWFAKGTQVFHAAVYAEPKSDPAAKGKDAERIEPFFSGLKFQ